jgi:hypothetical protein
MRIGVIAGAARGDDWARLIFWAPARPSGLFSARGALPDSRRSAARTQAPPTSGEQTCGASLTKYH